MKLTMIENDRHAGQAWTAWRNAALAGAQSEGRHSRIKTKGPALWCHWWRLGTANFYVGGQDVSIVQVNRPNGAARGDTRAVCDVHGRRYIVHRAKLQQNPVCATVEEAQFFDLTGLAAVELSRDARPSERNWVVVARIDDRTPAQIREDTVRFVRRCWDARLAVGGKVIDRRLVELGFDTSETDEPGSGGTGLIGGHQRSVSGGQYDVDPLHDYIVKELDALVAATGRKSHRPKIRGFEPDAIVPLPNACGEILVEIKTSRDAGAMHCGIGQLMFYPELFGQEFVARVLLMPKKPAADEELCKLLARIGITLLTYDEQIDSETRRISFEPAFLVLCHLGR